MNEKKKPCSDSKDKKDINIPNTNQNNSDCEVNKAKKSKFVLSIYVPLFFLITLIVILILYFIYLFFLEPNIGDSRTSSLIQFVFNIGIASLAFFTGQSSTIKRAKADATNKWLPAAEIACNELITIRSTANRIERLQGTSCDILDKIFPQNSDLDAIKGVILKQCGFCKENTKSIKNHIENNLKDWTVFIRNNCEDDCNTILCNLQRRLDELEENRPLEIAKNC